MQSNEDWPIFIVGCRRSGASLLRYLIDTHEDIACPPESKFLSGLFAFLQYPNTLEGLTSLGLTKPDIARELGRFATAIMSSYAKKKGKSRWADKTASYHRILDFVDDIFEQRVQYLFVIRHPLDNVESLYQNGTFSAVTSADPEIKDAINTYGAGRYGYAKLWADTNERIYLFASAHAGRSMVVRYEDLVIETDKTAESVFKFVGAEYTSSLVAQAFLQPHDLGDSDASIAATRSIEANRMEKWARWPQEEISSLWLIVGPLAERLGYKKPDRNFPQSWAP